jgi:hypothetical protein
MHAGNASAVPARYQIYPQRALCGHGSPRITLPVGDSAARFARDLIINIRDAPAIQNP